MAKILSVLLAVGCFLSPAFADETAERKQELAKLKNQAQKKEAELKKYREQEKKISKEISALQTKQAKAEQMKNKVELDISVVEQNLISIEDKRTALERSMPMWQGVVWEEIKDYYFEPVCVVCPEEQGQVELGIFLDRMLTHKAVFAVALEGENQEARERFAAFTQRNKTLQAQSSKLKQEQAIISQSFQKKQKDLDITKRKMDSVRKEINELNKSASELNNLLASFERKRKQAAQKNTTTKAAGPKINVPPHSLPWPVHGKVLSQFGKEYRSDLNTWIFRDGIKIAASAGTSVRASASGSVIYAGPFRSYGNVVIMDHGKGFFTIYGFLREIQVSVGDKLESQGIVGTAGKDTQASSGTGEYAVYFEIRQGTTAVDPLDWLK